MMEQKVQTREEAQLEAERRKRFNDLNREIVEGYREAVSGQVRMLRAFWEITKDGLWQLEYDKVEDWLGFLYDAGVKYAARSTYYHKIGLIKKFIDVVGEDFALRLAAEHDGAVKLLETSQSLVFEKHGRGQAASFSLVKADASILTEDPKQYLEDLARSSSRQGLAKVKQDTKRKEFITADWAPDYFYEKLIDEINRLYRGQLPISLSVLIRKLMENLVIDILRSKYSKSDAVGRALFYDDSKRKFYEFSALVRNLREKRADFLHITSSIDRIINDIDEYRETGNAGAHSIEANITIEQWSKDKQRVNYVVNGLLRILKSV